MDISAVLIEMLSRSEFFKTCPEAIFADRGEFCTALRAFAARFELIDH